MAVSKEPLTEMTDTYTCEDHTEMPSGYVSWHHHADWFKNHGYKQRKCGDCGLWAIVLRKDGSLVHSSYHEMKAGQR